MGELISFHTPHLHTHTFYEVLDHEGNAMWAGADPKQAIHWFWYTREDESDLLPRSMVVTLWETDIEDARMVGGPIDITGLMKVKGD